MSAHTPGPWRWELRYCGLRGPDGRSVLATDGMGIPDYSPESEANARLISAAPELLEALRPLAFFSGDLSGQADRDRLNDLFAIARAAIARAEGRA